MWILGNSYLCLPSLQLFICKLMLTVLWRICQVKYWILRPNHPHPYSNKSGHHVSVYVCAYVYICIYACVCMYVCMHARHCFKHCTYAAVFNFHSSMRFAQLLVLFHRWGNRQYEKCEESCPNISQLVFSRARIQSILDLCDPEPYS